MNRRRSPRARRGARASFRRLSGAIFAGGLIASGLLAGEAPAQSMPGRSEPRAAGRDAAGGRFRAVALSLLCPGLGHLQLDRTGRSLPYLVAEGAIWTTFGVSRVQGSWRRDSYVEMARLDAGVAEPEGRADSYYRLIGAWPSSDLYNEVIRREARTLHPDDLEARAAYFEANRVAADIAWRWESQAAWDRYREKRNESRRAYRRARNMLGLALANRVAAMIDAALLAQRDSGRSALRLEVAPGDEPGAGAVQLTLRLP